mmetsp:Transcript_26354/g.44981  ORF Transcript_26354/g.44981 Transcript_26354/m.44981 type:complete len:233 (-) Transcript_26354:125-823(-)|eukprot:CAMPEP_0183769444 /NCGR_PEP_ID=MMETSP0739-20130205/21913_1 /TAXON_ID=385413 /ORGANISM="Thalassiosira miniscula, Strain CCMP1093" /LENGTH=232 /DNA_ID=CAMNT_0026009039 /DNA_START=193 /DNA_END=891 /DNA_ORIENTATION=-
MKSASEENLRASSFEQDVSECVSGMLGAGESMCQPTEFTPVNGNIMGQSRFTKKAIFRGVSKVESSDVTGASSEDDARRSSFDDDEEEKLRLRVRELEAQLLVEDRLRVRIREMEKELAIRKERTERLRAAIESVTSCNWAAPVSASAHSSSPHALWNMPSSRMVDAPALSMGTINNKFSLVVDDAQSNHFRPQYVTPEEFHGELQPKPSTVSRSNSSESLENYPSKKRRHS